VAEGGDLDRLRASELVVSADRGWLTERAAGESDPYLVEAWSHLASGIGWRPAPSTRTTDAHDDEPGEVTPHAKPDAWPQRDEILAELQRLSAEREAAQTANDAKALPALRAALNAARSDPTGYRLVDEVLNPTERSRGSSLPHSPAWRAIDNALRDRVRDLARRFLLRATDEDDYRSVGYRALDVLGDRAAGLLDELDGSRREALLAEVIRRQDTSYPRERYGLFEAVAVAMPEEMAMAIYAYAETESAVGGNLWDLAQRLEHVAVGRIDAILASRVAGLSTEIASDVLDALLARGSADAIAAALTLIEARGPLAARAAALTVTHVREPQPLDRAVAAMEADSSLAHDAIDWTAERGARFNHYLATLPEDIAARLFRLGARAYPDYAEDAWLFQIRAWLDWHRSRLEGAQTIGSVRALEWLARELPELPWLHGLAAQVREHVLSTGWQPPTPKHVIRMLHDSERRYVTTGDHLLDVVADALEQVQSDLDSQDSGVAELWHRRDKDEYEPVSEPEISSWLQRRLKEKLVGRGTILHREAQVSQPAKPALGKRTDLEVAISGPDLPAPLRVIIEVKASWSRDLDAGLSAQLVGDYLVGTRNRFGIYVVAWFDVSAWRPGSRKSTAAGREEAVEMSRLTAAARQLESDHDLRLVVFALTVGSPI
jgi:hypothetical protein